MARADKPSQLIGELIDDVERIREESLHSISLIRLCDNSPWENAVCE
jgi:hypothetical protein